MKKGSVTTTDGSGNETTTETAPTISYNKATSGSGGGIAVTDGATEFTMQAGTITNNEATAKGAAIWYDKNITITGGTISNNVVANETADAAVCSDKATNLLTLGGNPTIYNNKYGTGATAKQRNVYECSDADAATHIKVDSSADGSPLQSSAKIGIYSKNNADAGDQFAKTYSAPAAGTTTTSQTCSVAGNLKCFVNDVNTNLTGSYGKEAYVIWASQEWLDLTTILPSVGSIYNETWFVVELKDTTNDEVYRQAICVDKKTGGASATKAVLVRSGVPYQVTLKTNNGTWRYPFSSAALAGSMASASTPDTWTAAASSATYNGTLTLQPAEYADDTPATGYHELKITTQQKTDQWLDDYLGVVNTMVKATS